MYVYELKRKGEDYVQSRHEGYKILIKARSNFHQLFTHLYWIDMQEGVDILTSKYPLDVKKDQGRYFLERKNLLSALKEDRESRIKKSINFLKDLLEDKDYKGFGVDLNWIANVLIGYGDIAFYLDNNLFTPVFFIDYLEDEIMDIFELVDVSCLDYKKIDIVEEV